MNLNIKTKRFLLFIFLILTILFTNDYSIVSGESESVIQNFLECSAESQDNISLIITHAYFDNKLLVINVKFSLVFIQDTTITTSNANLFYYTVACTNKSWYIPQAVLPMFNTHNFEKGIYSYDENIISFTNDGSIIEPEFFHISVGIDFYLPVYDSCKIYKNSNYTYINEITSSNNIQITTGFTNYSLLTLLAAITLIKLLKKNKF